MHIKQINKTSEQDNKALRSALTAALSLNIFILFCIIYFVIERGEGVNEKGGWNERLKAVTDDAEWSVEDSVDVTQAVDGQHD